MYAWHCASVSNFSLKVKSSQEQGNALHLSASLLLTHISQLITNPRSHTLKDGCAVASAMFTCKTNAHGERPKLQSHC